MLDRNKIKKAKNYKRRMRVRSKIFGTAQRPRLNVFRSLKHVSAQLIDDEQGKTLLAVNDSQLKGDKIQKAQEVGKLIAQRALEKDIKECVFDKSAYRYHGRVKALAEAAREVGLKF